MNVRQPHSLPAVAASERLAPQMHDLLRLATLAGLSLEESNRDFLKMFGVYQMEGRYPDVFPQAPDLDLTRKRLGEAERIYRWLMNLLSA